MKVRFKNFRCFRDTGILELKKITLLVGENSSGKTSFLGGLRHLSALMTDENINLNSPPFEMGTIKDIINQQNPEQSEFIYEFSENDVLYRWVFYDDEGDSSLKEFVTERGNDKEKEGFAYNNVKKSITFNHKLSLDEVQTLKDMNIDVNDNHGNGYYSFDLIIPDSVKFKNRFKLSQYASLDEIIKLINFTCIEYFISYGDSATENKIDQKPFIQTRKLDELFAGKVKLATKITETLSSFQLNFIKAVALSPLRVEPSRIYQYNQTRYGLDPSGSQIPDKLQRQFKSNKAPDKETIKQMKKFGQESGLFKNLSIKRYDKKSNYPFSIIVTTNQGIKSNIIDVGYGVSQTLPLIFEISSSQHEIRFLLQQPEIHLHPRAQSAFGSLMAQSVRNKDTEFVVETHSDFILERLKYEIAKGVISHNDVGILFFDTEEKEVKVWQIDIDKSGLPIEPPAAYRRFFFEETERVWF